MNRGARPGVVPFGVDAPVKSTYRAANRGRFENSEQIMFSNPGRPQFAAHSRAKRDFHPDCEQENGAVVQPYKSQIL